MSTRPTPHLGTCHVCGRGVRGYAQGLLWDLPGELDSIVLCRGACEETAGRAIARALKPRKTPGTVADQTEMRL